MKRVNFEDAYPVYTPMETGSRLTSNYIRKNFALRLVRLVRQKHRAHQVQIAVLDASLPTHFVRTRTLPVRAPQTPPGTNPPASSIFSQP